MSLTQIKCELLMEFNVENLKPEAIALTRFHRHSDSYFLLTLFRRRPSIFGFGEILAFFCGSDVPCTRFGFYNMGLIKTENLRGNAIAWA